MLLSNRKILLVSVIAIFLATVFSLLWGGVAQTQEQTLPHGAGAWHDAGYTGAGVKVGVIDFGFQDLPTHPLSSDIDGQLCFEPRSPGNPVPSDVSSFDIAVCQRPGLLTPPGHGTLSVEAVHLLAPDAEVYITNPTEPTQISPAIDWLIEQEVDVIIRTHGWAWEGAGDGRAFAGISQHPFYENRVAIYSAVEKATEAGIVWAQGMGNAAPVMWTGAFSDPDRDGWHNFSGADECNDVGLAAYPQVFYPWLRWQDTVGDPSNIRNLDFYLLNRRGNVDLQDLT